jgi:hypothetical protein
MFIDSKVQLGDTDFFRKFQGFSNITFTSKLLICVNLFVVALFLKEGFIYSNI